MERKRLTLKQERFVREYIKDGNGSRAVSVAYPNISTDLARRVMASKLVTNNNVKREIQEVLDREGLTAELVVQELKKILEGEDVKEKNKALRTAAEILSLIGRGGIVATQVNVSNGRVISDEDLEAMRERLRQQNLKKEVV